MSKENRKHNLSNLKFFVVKARGHHPPRVISQPREFHSSNNLINFCIFSFYFCLLVGNLGWRDAFNRLVEFLDEYDKDRKFDFSGRLRGRFEKLENGVMESIIFEATGSLIPTARVWIRKFRKSLYEMVRVSGVKEVLMTRELRSFISNPENHLKKKIMFYLHDALRNVISIEEFEEKAFAAVKTSIRTNMRTIYQDWVYINIVTLITYEGGGIVYPENLIFSLERSGAQRVGWIPPNVILRIPSYGYISMFIEAPRPIGWGDSKELKKIWKLYTTLRPDMMIRGGKVLNILDLSSDPPVKRPDAIIEVKELSDWFDRAREVRGPFAEPLTVEKWRSMWIEGLWDGLAGILGVERKSNRDNGDRKKVRRLKDVDIVKLYQAVYRPKIMIVVTRKRTPSKIRKELESSNIIVVDNVGFNRNNLRYVVELLKRIARKEEEITLKIWGELYKEISCLADKIGCSEEELVYALLRIGLRHESEIRDFVKGY